MVRVASYRNQLWIIALLGAFWAPATAQAPPSAAQAQSAGVRVTSLRPAERQTADFSTVKDQWQSPNLVATAQNGAVANQATTTAKKPTAPAVPDAQAGEVVDGNQVQTAGVLPDGSLLPVAGLVGFSFLFGGIVCGALKRPRP